METRQKSGFQIRHLWSELRQPIGFNDPNDDELVDFDRRFMRILLKHLAVLGWWSIVCLLVGAGALLFSTGQWYYFLMMSFVWGGINFAVTWAIFHHAFFRKFRADDAFERFEIHGHVQSVMFLNIGIDSAYIFVGCWLREHSFRCGVEYAELWAGFGWAIIVQGIFLMVQDSWFARLHHRNLRKAKPYLQAFFHGK